MYHILTGCQVNFYQTVIPSTINITAGPICVKLALAPATGRGSHSGEQTQTGVCPPRVVFLRKFVKRSISSSIVTTVRFIHDPIMVRNRRAIVLELIVYP